jgi:NADH:ubiquinone oxidoreductase subunit E
MNRSARDAGPALLIARFNTDLSSNRAQKRVSKHKEKEKRSRRSQMEQAIDVDFMKLDTLIEEKYDNNQEALVMILQELNAEYNYVPPETLRYVAEKMDIPLSKIYSVATFYKAFHLEPRGRHIISQCVGTACHVRGAMRIKGKVEKSLSVKAGENTNDMRYTFETVRCIGCCSLGPVIKIDDDVYSNVEQEQVDKILGNYQ